MGCDIHAWVELTNPKSTYVTSIATVRLDRNYSLFGLLAGVRGRTVLEVMAYAFDVDEEATKAAMKTLGENGFAPCEPKGLPDQLGWDVQEELSLQGYSKHMAGKDFDHGERGKGVYSWPPADIVDHHSFSWMTTAELQKVVHLYSLLPMAHSEGSVDDWMATIKATGEIPPRSEVVRTGGRVSRIDAVLAMMETLDASGEGQSRLVFWFDN